MICDEKINDGIEKRGANVDVDIPFGIPRG